MKAAGTAMQRANELIKRYDAAKTRTMLYYSLFEQAYRYVLPDKQLYNTETEGSKKNALVYDTTAVKACQRFASKVQTSIIPPGERWMKLVIGAHLQAELDSRSDGKAMQAQITEQLQDATDLFFKYLDNSNFALVANEAFYDLAIGTAAILCNEGTSDEKPLEFSQAPLRNYVPEEGPNGSILTNWRELKSVQARNIPLMWPNAELPVNLQTLIRDKGDDGVDFIEGTIYEPKSDSFNYVVIHKDGNSVIYEEMSQSSPWITFRWSRVDNEIFGRGPAIQALPTIQTLNKIAEYELTAAAFKAMPLWTGFSDGVFNPNNLRIQPNTFVPVNPSAIGGQPPLQKVSVSDDVKFTQMLVADLRNQVNDFFFANPLGPIDTPTKTATEITYRQQQFAEEVGPAFGRLQVEFLAPLVKRVIFILRKRGLFPNIAINGKIIDIEFQSPLAQTQAVAKIGAFQSFVSTLQQIIGPQLTMGVINVEKVPEYLGEQYDVDMSLVKNSDQLTAIAAQMAQAQQQQPQLPNPGVPQLGAPQQQQAQQ